MRGEREGREGRGGRGGEERLSMECDCKGIVEYLCV